MKFKLYVHQRTFSEEEVVINPRDFPNLSVGDVLEIYHPDDESCHLLLQVKSLDVDFQQKGTISVDQSIATAFMLRPYFDVIVEKVQDDQGVLDMVELILKDQYLNSSDMWRFRRSLIGSCVYLSKKVSFSGMRVQVNEMWSLGEKVACGKISKDTKVLFRSQSAQIHLLLQMSAEMWEFDLFGDLYFERASNGFLSELFGKWMEKNCTHEITVVLFSRTYYQAKSIDEFPKDMQRNIIRSSDNLFYQDFFKTITFSEKCDDWQSVMIKLKKNFTEYLESVGCTKESTPTACPHGWNSKAAEGNILEAMNISLNIFDKHFIDCCLELTNWSLILVTPGQGVFNVCKELTGLTKRRVMDSGVGIDLVCLAEQPLHAVPLFRCTNTRSKNGLRGTEDYYIPPWINYSFYSSQQQTKSCAMFIPRMKIPQLSLLSEDEIGINGLRRQSNISKQVDPVDFDKYDAQVFLWEGMHSSASHRRKHSSRRKVDSDHAVPYRFSPESLIKQLPSGSQDLTSLKSESKASSALLFPLNNTSDVNEGGAVKGYSSASDIQPPSNDEAALSGKYGIDVQPGQSPQDPDLVNPFRPYSFSYKTSLFTQRWKHAFPTGPGGEAVHEHHRVVSKSEGNSKSPAHYMDLAAAAIGRGHVLSGASSGTELEDTDIASEGDSISIKTTSEAGLDDVGQRSRRRSTHDCKGTSKPDDWNDTLFLYSADNNASSTIMTLVDWKSLTVPACLPLTTDFFPDKRTLEDDYVEYNYNLIIDDSTHLEQRAKEDGLFGRCKMNAKEKFDEIIFQRLAQGFQMVTNREKLKSILVISERSRHTLKCSPQSSLQEEHVLSLGDNIHHVMLCEYEVLVNKYAARHITIHKPIDYRYNLWPHTAESFCPASTRFSHEGLEKYNWNYLDQYVTSAEGEFNELSDDLKYWRTRFVLLPIRKMTSDQSCSVDEEMGLIEGFLRLLEALNRIRRPTTHRRLFQTRRLHDGREGPEATGKRRQVLHSRGDQSRMVKRCDKGEKGSKEKLSEDQALHPKSGLKSEDAVKESGNPEVDGPEKPTKSKTDRAHVELSPQGTGRKTDEDEEKVTAEKEKVKETSKRELTKSDSDPRPKAKGGKEVGSGNEAGRKDPEKKVNSEESPDASKNIDPDVKKGASETALNPSKMPPEHALSVTSELEEIVRVMQNPEYGLSFLPEQSLLRPWTFISAEAVAWMIKSIDGVDRKADAVTICQKLLDKNLIIHASGTSKEEFKDGFVLYYIDQAGNAKARAKKGEEELLRNYNTQWAEVSVWRENMPEDVAWFLQPDPVSDNFGLDGASQRIGDHHGVFKNIDLKVDPLKKGDRPEWCLAYFHANYFPMRAFSLELHWMVATGSIISELVQGWARKATSGGLHLVPAPVTPFPPPLSSGKVNPLLKSTYVQLALDSLMKDDSRHVFHEFEKSSWDKRLLLFQEAILFRFGFLRDLPKSATDVSWQFEQRVFPKARFYIHWSGSLLVKIEERKADGSLISPTSSVPPSVAGGKTERELLSYRQSSSRVKLAVHRVLMDLEDPGDEKRSGVGFHCIFNYALTKKWRSTVTGDQESASRLLSDLSDFCSNRDHALVDFWNEEYSVYLRHYKNHPVTEPVSKDSAS